MFKETLQRNNALLEAIAVQNGSQELLLDALSKLRSALGDAKKARASNGDQGTQSDGNLDFGREFGDIYNVRAAIREVDRRLDKRFQDARIESEMKNIKQEIELLMPTRDKVTDTNQEETAFNGKAIPTNGKASNPRILKASAVGLLTFPQLAENLSENIKTDVVENIMMILTRMCGMKKITKKMVADTKAGKNLSKLAKHQSPQIRKLAIKATNHVKLMVIKNLQNSKPKQEDIPPVKSEAQKRSKHINIPSIRQESVKRPKTKPTPETDSLDAWMEQKRKALAKSSEFLQQEEEISTLCAEIEDDQARLEELQQKKKKNQ